MKRLVKCTICRRSITIDVPLQFDSTVSVFASYYQKVRSGMKVLLFEIQLSQLGCSETGNVRHGDLGRKNLVLEFKKPSKKLHQQMNQAKGTPGTSEKKSEPDSAAADQTNRLNETQPKTGGSPHHHDHGQGGGEAQSSGDVDDDVEIGDEAILEGAHCLLEEAERSGHHVDDEISGIEPDGEEIGLDTTGDSDAVSTLLHVMNHGGLDQGLLSTAAERDQAAEHVSADVKPVEEAVAQLEGDKLKNAIASNRNIVTNEVRDAASKIQDEQDLLPEEAVAEACLNDVKVAGNTVYLAEPCSSELGHLPYV